MCSTPDRTITVYTPSAPSKDANGSHTIHDHSLPPPTLMFDDADLFSANINENVETGLDSYD